jgi:hypothetical protein
MIIQKRQKDFVHDGMLMESRITYWFLFIPVYSVNVSVQSGISAAADGGVGCL